MKLSKLKENVLTYTYNLFYKHNKTFKQSL